MIQNESWTQFQSEGFRNGNVESLKEILAVVINCFFKKIDLGGKKADEKNKEREGRRLGVGLGLGLYGSTRRIVGNKFGNF